MSGHAIGAVAFSAAKLGWRTRLIDTVGDDELALLLGVDRQQGIEAEHPDCLLAVFPARADTPATIALRWPAALGPRLQAAEFAGTPNRLSHDHQPWPVIDEVAEASRCAVAAETEPSSRRTDCQSVPDEPPLPPAELASAPYPRPPAARRANHPPAAKRGRHGRANRHRSRRVLRDHGAADARPAGGVRIAALLRSLPFDALPWPPHVSLALFVHRVQRLTPGVYLLVRDPRHEASLRGSLRTEFLWQPAGGLSRRRQSVAAARSRLPPRGAGDQLSPGHRRRRRVLAGHAGGIRAGPERTTARGSIPACSGKRA